MILWAADLADCDSWVGGRFGLLLLHFSVFRGQSIGQCGVGSVRHIPNLGFNAAVIICLGTFLNERRQFDLSCSSSCPSA